MEETLFYVFGGALILAAVALTAVGLRVERFPGSRGATLGLLTLFALLVAGTGTFAVLHAEEEQEHREAEDAEAAAEPEEEATGGGPVTTLTLSAPEDGSLVFEPDQLTAKPGDVEIEFTNPAAVQHDVVLADAEDQVLAASELIDSGASASVTDTLEPGEYRFFCDVPGHEEAGMEGTLTVK